LTFLVKTGTINTPTTATSSFGVTGLGFQPKAIIFFAGGSSSDDSVGVFYDPQISFTDGTNQIIASGVIVNGATPSGSTVGTTFDNTKVWSLLSTGPATVGTANIVSFDVDGFTLNFTQATTARKLNYIALGGTDITNVKAGTFTGPADNVTGNLSTTGVGFKPDLVLFNWTNRGPASTTPLFLLSVGLGATDGTGQFCSYVGANASSPIVTARYQRIDKCIGCADTSATTLQNQAGIVSLDSGGWTLNYDTNSSQITGGYLAIKGIKAKVGSFTSNTSTGSQAVTGAGFQPKGLLLTSTDDVASTTIDIECCNTYGAADSSTSRRTCCCDEPNALATTNSSQYNSQTGIFAANSSATTLNAKADLTSFDANGFTLNWGTNDGVKGAMQICYVAMGPTSTPTGGMTNVATLTYANKFIKKV
jgi:hypothetical protein